MSGTDGKTAGMEIACYAHVRPDPDPPHLAHQGDLVRFRALIEGYHALVAAALKAHEKGMPSFFSYCRSVEVYEERMTNRTALDEIL